MAKYVSIIFGDDLALQEILSHLNNIWGNLSMHDWKTHQSYLQNYPHLSPRSLEYLAQSAFAHSTGTYILFAHISAPEGRWNTHYTTDGILRVVHHCRLIMNFDVMEEVQKVGVLYVHPIFGAFSSPPSTIGASIDGFLSAFQVPIYYYQRHHDGALYSTQYEIGLFCEVVEQNVPTTYHTQCVRGEIGTAIVLREFEGFGLQPRLSGDYEMA